MPVPSPGLAGTHTFLDDRKPETSTPSEILRLVYDNRSALRRKPSAPNVDAFSDHPGHRVAVGHSSVGDRSPCRWRGSAAEARTLSPHCVMDPSSSIRLCH